MEEEKTLLMIGSVNFQMNIRNMRTCIRIFFRFLIFSNIAIIVTGIVLCIRNQPNSHFLREISASKGFESVVALVLSNSLIFTFYFLVCFFTLFINAVFLWVYIRARLVPFSNIAFVVLGILFHLPNSQPSNHAFQIMLETRNSEKFILYEFSQRYLNSIYLFTYLALLIGDTILLWNTSKQVKRIEIEEILHDI
jgi:ABC-type Fe3+-siderophore transport system permease subunit